ncbi:ankyrin repeat-containing protein BDA1-like [Rhododendron vialii]|uniref:ankyrin repeat-containing protein BDA1-like n=1 Tax=Rhododendron vialii TaxID=182163 RepID=UPI00265F2F5A|nr:ankyrin repeat-containing protein BDA1-like [Rhododendron vialii]
MFMDLRFPRKPLNIVLLLMPIYVHNHSSSLIKMDPNSKEAVEARNIDILYESIGSDPYILDKADESPFVHSPVHVAASTGQTRLAIEIMNLKPSLGRKLNPDGLSPMHLALLNGHSETAKALIKLDKDLVRVRGRERLTPLQYAAETDDRVDILAEFLCACPESIGDLNVRGETALHIAVKKCNARALAVLMGWIRKTGKHWVKNIKMVNYENIDTLVATDQKTRDIILISDLHVQIVESVVQGYGLHMKEKNLEGATALDIAETLKSGSARTTIKGILHGAGASKSSLLANDCSLVDFLISRESQVETIFRTFLFMRKGMSLEMRNAVLVVAVLITTATFQTVLSPPGGGSGLSDGNSLFANGSHINATIFTSTDNSSLFANGSHINATIFTSTHNISLFANGSHINATVFTSMDDATNVFLSVFYAMNTVAFISSIAMINILILPLKVFAPLHASLMFLTMGYGIAFLIIPPMYNLEFIFAFSAIAVASLLYGVHYIPIMIEDLHKIDKGLLFMSHLQRKRLRMLYRVVMD